MVLQETTPWSGVKRKVEISGSLDLRSSTIQRIRSIWLFIPAAYLDISRASCPTFLFDVLLPPLQIQRRREKKGEGAEGEDRAGMPDKRINWNLFEARTGMQLNFIMSVIVAHIKRKYRSLWCPNPKLTTISNLATCLATSLTIRESKLTGLNCVVGVSLIIC